MYDAWARVPEAQTVLGASGPQEAVHLLVSLLRGSQVLLSTDLQHNYNLVFILTVKLEDHPLNQSEIYYQLNQHLVNNFKR